MVRRSVFLLLAFSVVAIAAGCGDDSGGGGADLGSGICESDGDCADDRFCNGTEVCMPSSPLASARGCIAGSPPCSRECDEVADSCPADCEVADMDGDGSDAIECGGGDCDDMDPNRHPGNTEVCDEDHVDEDCDGTTFGGADADGDGYSDGACCNRTSAGDLSCGDDCDDGNDAIHPGEAESCDTLDNDCDGSVDETVGTRCWVDADNDGFAAADAEVVMVCGDCGTDLTGTEPGVDALIDCDDDAPTTYPLAREICDRVDNDCSSGGGVDESEDADEDGHAPPDSSCEETPSSLPKNDCDDTNADVFGGQTQYFTEPLCESPCECGSGGLGCFVVDGSVGRCRCNDPEDWDYDCSGETDLLPQNGCGDCFGGCGGGIGISYDTGVVDGCGEAGVERYTCSTFCISNLCYSPDPPTAILLGCR